MLTAVVFTLASLHLNDSRHYNQINPGVGVEWRSGLGVGAYLNSSARLSVYSTFSREKALGSRVAVGFEAGGVTGYKPVVLPLVFPFVRVTRGAWSLKVNVLPTKRPIVGFQVRWMRDRSGT